MRPLCCLALTLALPLGAAGAQGTPALAPGTRVRVTTPSNIRVVGTLEFVDSVTIVVRPENAAAAKLPRTPGTQVDISAGPGTCRTDRRGTCVIVGILAGAALGFGAGKIAESQCDFCGGQIYPYTLTGGALVGAIVGAVVGGEHWKRAELPARVSLAPAVPGASGPWRALRVGVSLTF